MFRGCEMFLLLVWTSWPLFLRAYQAPEDKEDIFATSMCPAFLVFDSVAFLSDMTVDLPCHCKPEEAHAVVWYYQRFLGAGDTRVLTDFSGTTVMDASKVGRDLDLRRRFTIRLFSLIIFRVREEDSGHYVCGTASGEFFYGFDMDVQAVHQVLFPWNLVPANGTQPQKAEDKPFQMFTSFWPWSVCDRCGVKGEQTRVGLCYIKSKYLQVRYLRKSSNVTSCGSSAVPPSFGLTAGSYGAELLVRSCYVPCSRRTTTVSPKRKSLLHFLGYSNSKSLGLRVYHHNHPADSNLVLSCPGAKPQHAVAWDKGSTPLYRSQFIEGLGENSRVFIDAGHHLHFRPVLLKDKGKYYCWIQGKKAAEIKLGVYSGLGRERRFSDPESLVALKDILIIYGIMTAVFLLIISARFYCSMSKEQSGL